MENNVTTENAIIMKMARESLKGKWSIAIVTHLIYFLLFVFFIALMIIPVIGPIIFLLFWSAMPLGFAIFTLSLSRKEETKFIQIFHGFKNYGTSIKASILMAFFIFLQLLLLIIPGIIAIYSYSMTFFIIADDNSITAMEALGKSKRMMHGHKWKLFCLCFRFIGWSFLSTLTFFIGYLWFYPYLSVSIAKFYDDLKAIYEDSSGSIIEKKEQPIIVKPDCNNIQSNKVEYKTEVISNIDFKLIRNEALFVVNLLNDIIRSIGAKSINKLQKIKLVFIKIKEKPYRKFFKLSSGDNRVVKSSDTNKESISLSKAVILIASFSTLAVIITVLIMNKFKNDDKIVTGVFTNNNHISTHRDETLAFENQETIDQGNNIREIVDFSLTASSVLESDEDLFNPYAARDNNAETAWAEGVPGDGIGERLIIEFDQETTITSVSLINGFAKIHDKYGNLYLKNNRIKSVLIQFDDGAEVFDLIDNDMNFQQLIFKNNHKSKTMIITIQSVYKGDIWQDTCLSELKIYGY